MNEDYIELLDYLLVLRMKIRLIRIFLQMTRIVLRNYLPENKESPTENRLNQTTKNNRARKLLRSKKKDESSAKIKEKSTETRKQRAKKEKIVLSATRS